MRSVRALERDGTPSSTQNPQKTISSQTDRDACDDILHQMSDDRIGVRPQMAGATADDAAAPDRRPAVAEVSHPFCSEPYVQALEDADAHVRHVPEWRTHVVVRELASGIRQATGIRPVSSLDPDCDLEGGLDALRREGISSVSLVTDPMWSPDLPALQRAFTICRAFKENYFIDRSVGSPRPCKRHRNNINRAKRSVEVRSLSLAESLERWDSLYQGNVDRRRIVQPFSKAYFEQLAQVEGLETIAALVQDEIVTMTLWLRHRDVLYYLDGASSPVGLATAGSYGAFAYVIESATDCRYVMFGGSAGLIDNRIDGLAIFKRGFSNGSVVNHLCSTNLQRSERHMRGSVAPAGHLSNLTR